MKILNIKAKSHKFLKFLKAINLLDGQRRGEVVFRRVFVLLVAFVMLYLFLLATVGKKEEQNVEQVEAIEVVEIGIDGVGNVVQDGEIINGQEVTVENGKASYIVEYDPVTEQVKAIESFVFDIYKGRYSREYFDLLVENCSEEGLRTVIAISVAESSMGKNSKRKSNWYGWFKNGDRNYDPSQEEMAREICSGVEKSYLGIGNDMSKARKYVGSVSASWLSNYRWAYNQMEVK